MAVNFHLIDLEKNPVVTIIRFVKMGFLNLHDKINAKPNIPLAF